MKDLSLICFKKLGAGSTVEKPDKWSLSLPFYFWKLKKWQLSRSSFYLVLLLCIIVVPVLVFESSEAKVGQHGSKFFTILFAEKALKLSDDRDPFKRVPWKHSLLQKFLFFSFLFGKLLSVPFFCDTPQKGEVSEACHMKQEGTPQQPRVLCPAGNNENVPATAARGKIYIVVLCHSNEYRGLFHNHCGDLSPLVGQKAPNVFVALALYCASYSAVSFYLQRSWIILLYDLNCLPRNIFSICWRKKSCW